MDMELKYFLNRKTVLKDGFARETRAPERIISFIFIIDNMFFTVNIVSKICYLNYVHIVKMYSCKKIKALVNLGLFT